VLVVKDRKIGLKMASTANMEKLIARYLNGDFSDQDEKELGKWINESQENKKLFLAIKDTWDASLKSTSRETEELLRFYKEQISRKQKLQFPVWVSGLAVAAVLVVGLLIGGLLQDNFSVRPSHVESFTVPMGSKSQLTLADGTKVNLNSDSRLELAADFSSKNRAVILTGEGYFEVTSDKKNPFILKTEKFDVLVTGTKFNISSYANDQKISATLTDGQIQLQTKTNKLFNLKPGQKISFDQKTMDYSLKQADIESELAWVDGNFIFKEIPFPDLVKRLERWYDVKILYEGEVFDSMVYSGKFKNQETIWEVLEALKLTTPIDFKKRNLREFELIYTAMNK
jgi:ferric-dicitrate binding protein FerR (iron transport regulator)